MRRPPRNNLQHTNEQTKTPLQFNGALLARGGAKLRSTRVHATVALQVLDEARAGHAAHQPRRAAAQMTQRCHLQLQHGDLGPRRLLLHHRAAAARPQPAPQSLRRARRHGRFSSRRLARSWRHSSVALPARHLVHCVSLGCRMSCRALPRRAQTLRRAGRLPQNFGHGIAANQSTTERAPRAAGTQITEIAMRSTSERRALETWHRFFGTQAGREARNSLSSLVGDGVVAKAKQYRCKAAPNSLRTAISLLSQGDPVLDQVHQPS